MKKLKLIFKSSFLSVVYFLLQVVISFFLTPFIISALTGRTYGIWVLVGTFIGYYGLLDMGISSAVMRFVARNIGSGKKDEVKYITSISFYIFLAVGLIICILSVIFTFFTSHFLKDLAEVSLFNSLILLLGIGTGISFPLRIFVGVLNANLRFDLARTIEIAEVIVRSILVVLALKSGYGILGLAFVSIFCMLLHHFLKMICAYTIDSNISINFKYCQFRRIEGIIGFSFSTFIQNIANILNSKVDTFVIAYFVNVVAVMYYSIALSLIQYFSDFIYSLLGIIGPIFSQKEGSRDLSGLRNNFYSVTKVCLSCATFIGIMIILYGQQFIVRWLGLSFKISYLYLVILVIPSIFHLGLQVSAYLLNNMNEHSFMARINIFEGIINLILSILLVKHYGAIGVAIGTAIPMIFFGGILRPIWACKKIDIDPLSYYLEVSRIILKVILLTVPIWMLFGKELGNGYRGLFIIFSIHFIVIVSLGYFILLPKQYSKLVKDKFLSLLPS